jgi:fused signal recognition particle receptor
MGEDEIKQLLAASISRRLAASAVPLNVTGAAPHIVLVVGVNGNGKTTTIGKLAHQLTGDGKKVMVVAADTFRAAAVEQLQQWAERVGCAFVRGAPNADPASVAYAGVEKAMADGVDVVFVDTAGRLHTKENLMAELSKITKVITKLIPDAPHAVVQVLDATTGQNALAQVKAFREVAGVTGLVVTKLDGTAKAGIIVALADQFKLPIHAIGVGEGAEDLQPFQADDFARALVGL